MSLDLDPDSMNFEDTAVTETEYRSVLEALSDKEGVLGVTHSLPLNEIRLYIDPDSTRSLRGYPAGITIRGAAYETHDEFGDCVRVTLTTSKYLADDETQAEYYGGAYSDEAMAFMKAQVDLFGEVDDSVLVRSNNTDQLLLLVKSADTITSTHVFDEVLTFLGGTIEAVTVVEGNLKYLLISFDGSRSFSREMADGFRLAKQRTWQNDAVDTADPISAPCDHDADTQLMMFDATVDIEDAPVVDINRAAFYRIDIEDPEAAVLSAATPDEESTEPTESTALGGTARGYLCSICDVAYVACDEDVLRTLHADPLPATAATVSVPDTNKTYTFFVFDRPYHPIEWL